MPAIHLTEKKNGKERDRQKERMREWPPAISSISMQEFTKSLVIPATDFRTGMFWPAELGARTSEPGGLGWN